MSPRSIKPGSQCSLNHAIVSAQPTAYGMIGSYLRSCCAACWLNVENPQRWGGLGRAPEATASLQAAKAALRGAEKRPEPSDGPGRLMGRWPQAG
jgi:hypothetical protein